MDPIVSVLGVILVVCSFLHTYHGFMNRHGWRNSHHKAVKGFEEELLKRAELLPNILNVKFSIFMDCLTHYFYDIKIGRDFRIAFVPKDFVAVVDSRIGFRFVFYEENVKLARAECPQDMERLQVPEELKYEYINLDAAKLYNNKAIDQGRYYEAFKSIYKEDLRERFFSLYGTVKKQGVSMRRDISWIAFEPLYAAVSELGLSLFREENEIVITHKQKKKEEKKIPLFIK